MALDKIVDSAKLDGALTATADVIRGKTGETAPIAWDANTGFAAAISAIAAGGGGGLKFWHGEITTTTDLTYMQITHNLASDKLIILAENLEVATNRPNYQPYRIISWSPELLTPHIRYRYGNFENEAYADESIPPTQNRPTSLYLDSGSVSASSLRISENNRNQNNTMLHSVDKNTVTWYCGSNLGIGRFAVTVIDISNCGIRYTEEG